ncbi:MAG: hypothetical protein HeimC2_05280 [Candidatus Heimdallarchaeota archaeon LC_2]|nr:MAG: hypothetical protein HeimC2_05280 [Candidatus Heimdallarchaeota archaeon LC_2]
MTSEKQTPGIFLILEFDWPKEKTPEMYEAARNLHNMISKAEWVEEIFAGFGGIGAGKASIWGFKMSKYADLDKLVNSYRQDQNEVSRAYSNFFKLMINVEEKIREEVVFV